MVNKSFLLLIFYKTLMETFVEELLHLALVQTHRFAVIQIGGDAIIGIAVIEAHLKGVATPTKKY